MWGKNYISRGEEVLSLSPNHFLFVEKVDDISRAYNGTSSGLNELMWAPQSMLLTISTHTRAIQHGTNMGGIDIGEKCLNFMMHKILRTFCGWKSLTYGLRNPNWKTGSHKHGESGNAGAGILLSFDHHPTLQ